MGDEIKDLNDLRGRVTGPVFTPEDEGYAAENACSNLGIIHTPDVTVGAASAADVAEAVKFAKDAGLAVSVQATGHTDSTITSGMLISTKRLTAVSVDPGSKVATIGAGAMWEAVVEPAGELGLAAVSGSSPKVGVTGYLLGGGLGPIVRSHGISSDYLQEVTVVNGEGEIMTANADENSDLFWALRGGKYGLGIVVESKVELVPLATLYAGSLFFAEEDIEAAYRGWLDWTASADDRVSTSAAILQFPPFDEIPEPLRGKRLLNVRFAFPGDTDEGARLAEPIRGLAPVYMDAIEEIPASEMARIHNDPTEPAPAWARGAMFARADGNFATKLLERVGAGTASPFVSVELRHLGSAAAVDVDDGSAAGGRSAGFAMAVVGANPAQFGEMPAAFAALMADLAPWLSEEGNINFMVVPEDDAHLQSAWTPDTWEKLEGVRKKYDPEGTFASYPVGGQL